MPFKTMLLCLVSMVALAQPSEQEPATVVLKSDVFVTTLREGKGKRPTAKDKVKVHYRGTLNDGTEFDSSYQRDQPATFPLSAVIKCWTEGVQRMKPGGKARLMCPPSTAYGARGAPPKIPPNATLTFEIELLEVVR